MPRISSIKKLPESVIQKIHTLRENGLTLDTILDHLNELDVDVSRSALGRYVKSRDKILERIRKSRDMATAIAKELGTETDDKIARANIEILHGLMMKAMMAEDGENVSFDPKEAMFMATALEKASKASQITTDRILKIREETKKIAANVAVKEAKRQGISQQTVDDIKSKILGVEV